MKNEKRNPLVEEFEALNPVASVSAEETTQQIMENAKKNTIPDNIKEVAAKLEKEAAEKIPEKPVQAAMENVEENKIVEPIVSEIVETASAEGVNKTVAEMESQQSSTDLQQEEQASVGSQEVDEDTAKITKLAQDIRDYTSQPGAIAMVLKALCERVPEIVPNYRGWGGTDPIPFMHAKIQAPGYIEALMNSLFLMLQDNIWNVRWTAQVVIGMTVTLVMLDMPQFLYEAQLRKEQEKHPVIVEEKPKLWLPGQVH